MSFSARDLALLLPDDVGEGANVKSSGREEVDVYEAPKPKIDASKKTRRYFPGKAPEWIPEDEGEITFTIDSRAATTTSSSEISSGDKDTPIDRRLARLQQKGSSSGGGRRRQRYEAEVIVEEETPSQDRHDIVEEGKILDGDSSLVKELEQAEEEEDINARRARIKARLIVAAREEEEKRTAAGNQIEEEDEESSEYETVTDSDESSSEDETDRIMLKPVFIPRSHRQTIREQEEKEVKAAEIRDQNELLKKESRKHQTRVLVAESVKRQDEKQALDALAATDVDSDSGLPDDTDLTDDDDDEYASWKIRELNRIKKEAERREVMIQERMDIERRRNMTDEERRAEDEMLGKFREKEKKKWKFLQKYYHKGVFYMDEESTGQVGTSVLASTSSSGSAIPSASYYAPNAKQNENEDENAKNLAEKNLDARLRDYSGATLEDNFDRESLPAVLQVKKFGMRGRTKYTHLADQDTTKFGSEAYVKDRNVQAKYLQKRSGVGDIDSAGRRKKKRDDL